MPLPFRFDELSSRFATVRPWAKTSFGDYNRCAMCMGYTLRISPTKAEGDASLSDLAGAYDRLRQAPPLRGAPDGGTAEQLFIRAAELLPRVQRAFGKADIQGPGREVWPRVEGRKGVLYVENCYQTSGDKTWTVKGIYEPSSGDHWDLFDGVMMVAEEAWIRDNKHASTMYFWQAR